MKIMVHPLQIQVLYLHRLTFLLSFFQVCDPRINHVSTCVAVGMFVRDPQQHVGQEWFADQRTGDDLCAVTLLQFHD